MKNYKDFITRLLVIVLALMLIPLGACAQSGVQSTSNPSSASVPVGGQNVTINVSAKSMAFDKSILTVPAGSNITIVFINQDSVPHNIAVYKTSAASEVIFRGDTISNKTITYQFKAPVTPGTYFFRCDVHPSTMTGSFIVTAANP